MKAFLKTIHSMVLIAVITLSGVIFIDIQGITVHASGSSLNQDLDLFSRQADDNPSAMVLEPFLVDPLNPPFPRIYYGTPAFSSQPAYSDGAMGEILTKYDF